MFLRSGDVVQKVQYMNKAGNKIRSVFILNGKYVAESKEIDEVVEWTLVYSEDWAIEIMFHEVE